MRGAATAVREAAREPWAWDEDGSREPSSGSEADVRTEADALDELGDEIARLAAHLHAGTGRLLALLADFDRRGGWKAGGHHSCAHWLAVRAGYDLRTARSHVRVARALTELPRIRAALAAGRLSFSQARALTRVATPETEADLLTLAEGCTTAVLERRIRAWRRDGRGGEDEAARAERIHRSRRLSVVPDEDGGYRVCGRLEPEVGAVLMRAIEAAADALYREEDGSAEPPSPEAARRRAARRRADALGLLAERALAAGFGEDGPVSGTRAERYQVFVHVDAAALAEDGEPGRSELADGTRLAPGTARRLACDGATVHVNRGEGGEVLDVGRRTRTVPPELPDDPVRSLVRENRLNGADPGPADPGARWKRERSVPDEIWFAATEAALGGAPP